MPRCQVIGLRLSNDGDNRFTCFVCDFDACAICLWKLDPAMPANGVVKLRKVFADGRGGGYLYAYI